ncbi:putative leucine-rich repeat-containing protein DDB_G0290503 [Hydractinia symbiolongicarpus]|uniref:putative leucine-rich repeat-containing protein DDB_G0290503 n=1 Tax=Hydractinia symbiolongicarpus TaxID=13093 RepID=UPI00254F0818|nr:putative leucine-rich repeat-containing protein DDB_G0290503 [Hydractinia symbiolongicarpus]
MAGKRKMKKNQYRNKSNKQVINNQLVQNKSDAEVKQSSNPDVMLLKENATMVADEEKLNIASNQATEIDFAINTLTQQLNYNTVIILSLKDDIANQAIEIKAKDATIAAMKIDQERSNSAYEAISKQNQILQKELAQTKLANKSINEVLLKMNQQHALLNASVEGYKMKVEAAETHSKSLEVQLLELTQKVKVYEDERAHMLAEIAHLKKKNEMQLEEVGELKATISKCQFNMKEKEQELANMKEREEKIYQENESTVAKLLAEHAIEVSLLQLQLEQERCQKENEISNLSREIIEKDTQAIKLQEQNFDLEANLKSLEKRFNQSNEFTQDIVGHFMSDIERKCSKRCFYKPRIKCSTVRSRLQLIVNKMNDEFSILH